MKSFKPLSRIGFIATPLLIFFDFPHFAGNLHAGSHVDPHLSPIFLPHLASCLHHPNRPQTSGTYGQKLPLVIIVNPLYDGTIIPRFISKFKTQFFTAIRAEVRCLNWRFSLKMY
jgi:hypothetical protein